MNDPAFVEIARGLATRIASDRPLPATDRDRLRYAFLLCLGRTPSSREIETLETVLRDEKETEGTIASKWLTVARVLLNIDEFVTRE